MAGDSVTAHGPLFDGRAERALHFFLDEAARVVGNQALSEVQRNLDQSIKHPTPYYETQITIERLNDDVVVHDRGIIYGPWLEGVSSRNQTTRFKGYSSFRRACQTVEGQAPALIATMAGRYIAEMGG